MRSITKTPITRQLTLLSQRRLISTARVNRNTTPKQPEEKKPQPISPHAAFYKDFGTPLVKVLGVTFVTYYGLQYLWEYLDSQEPEEHPNVQPINVKNDD